MGLELVHEDNQKPETPDTSQSGCDNFTSGLDLVDILLKGGCDALVTDFTEQFMLR